MPVTDRRCSTSFSAKPSQDPGIEDPPLTETGHAQSQELAEQFAQLDISRIIASPYTRALQTAHAVANRLDVPMTVDASVREACLCLRRRHRDASPGCGLAASRFFAPERDVVESREETIPAFHGRCAAFRSLIAAADDWDRVAVITRRGSSGH